MFLVKSHCPSRIYQCIIYLFIIIPVDIINHSSAPLVHHSKVLLQLKNNCELRRLLRKFIFYSNNLANGFDCPDLLYYWVKCFTYIFPKASFNSLEFGPFFKQVLCASKQISPTRDKAHQAGNHNENSHLDVS